MYYLTSIETTVLRWWKTERPVTQYHSGSQDEDRSLDFEKGVNRFQLLLIRLGKFPGCAGVQITRMKLGAWAERIEDFWSPLPWHSGAKDWGGISVSWIFCDGMTQYQSSKRFCKWEEQDVLGVPSFVLIFSHVLCYRNQGTVTHLSILNKMRATEMCLSEVGSPNICCHALRYFISSDSINIYISEQYCWKARWCWLTFDTITKFSCNHNWTEDSNIVFFIKYGR